MDEQSRKRRVIIDLRDRSVRMRWLLRLVSIFFAVALWFFVSWDDVSTSRTAVRTVPLRFTDVPDGYTLSCSVREVEVQLEGSVELLAMLDAGSVTAAISLKDYRSGRFNLPIHITVPEAILVASCTPRTAEVELYRLIERSMKPVVEITGSDGDEDGIDMQDITCSPDAVVLKGQEELVMAVRYAAVIYDGKSSGDGVDVDAELPIVLLGADDSEISGVTVEPPTVSVKGRIRRAQEEIDVPINVPIRGTPALGLELGGVEVEPATVKLRGTKAALANIAELTLAPINVSGSAEEIVAEIPLEAPAPGITIVGVDRVRIRVDIHSPVDAMTFVGVPITVIGTTKMKWTTIPTVANVTVERTRASTDPFDAQSPPFELCVDVTNVVKRRLVLPLTVRGLPDGMKAVRIEPQQVAATAVDE